MILTERVNFGKKQWGEVHMLGRAFGGEPHPAEKLLAHSICPHAFQVFKQAPTKAVMTDRCSWFSRKCSAKSKRKKKSENHKLYKSFWPILRGEIKRFISVHYLNLKQSSELAQTFQSPCAHVVFFFVFFSRIRLTFWSRISWELTKGLSLLFLSIHVIQRGGGGCWEPSVLCLWR